jgi:hypothetical protein
MSPDVASKVFLSIALVGGAALCFFGSRLFKVALGIGGLVCGSAVAAYLAWRYTAPDVVIQAASTPPEILRAICNPMNPTVILVCALCGGVAGAVVCALMHRVGVFAIGVCLGAALVHLTMAQAGVGTYLIVLAIVGLIGGILALLLRRTIVILSTAFNGALAFMLAIFALLKQHTLQEAAYGLRDFGNDFWVVLGCTVILTAIGGYVQFTTAPEPGKTEVLYKKVKAKKDET